ncbi:MAG: DUF2281 domain-containing protein [Nitrospirae bacterium]|nr:DUF2281 domain-containing protein [Nitrospirota bacterium]
MESLEAKIRLLPNDLQKEVEDFIDFLIDKKLKKPKKQLKLDWFGGLKEYRNQYTALELQKKASDWRD